jgi:hypothetical protein
MHVDDEMPTHGCQGVVKDRVIPPTILIMIKCEFYLIMSKAILDLCENWR